MLVSLYTRGALAHANMHIALAHANRYPWRASARQKYKTARRVTFNPGAFYILLCFLKAQCLWFGVMMYSERNKKCKWTEQNFVSYFVIYLKSEVNVIITWLFLTLFNFPFETLQRIFKPAKQKFKTSLYDIKFARLYTILYH